MIIGENTVIRIIRLYYYETKQWERDWKREDENLLQALFTVESLFGSIISAQKTPPPPPTTPPNKNQNNSPVCLTLGPRMCVVRLFQMV